MTGRLQREIELHLQEIRRLIATASSGELKAFERALEATKTGRMGWVLSWFAPVLTRVTQDARLDRKRFGLKRLKALWDSKQDESNG